MSARLLTALATGAALGAIATTGTAASAQDIQYEDGQYLYAVPADPAQANDSVIQTVLRADAAANEAAANERADNGIVLPTFAEGDGAPPVYAYDPVVQPMDARPATRGAVRTIPAQQAGASYAPPYAPGYGAGTAAGAAPDYAGSYPVVGQSGAYPAYQAGTPVGYQGGYAYPAAPQPGYQSGYLPGGGQLVSFDRNAWLAECRARVATYEDTDRARLIGTLVGAAAGGVIGNRVAGRGDRLGGTLLGAGAGAIAGSVVGDAIDDRNDARAYSDGYDADGGYCQAYLDDYMARASQGGVVTTTVPGQQYFLVPVTVSVAQEPVYAE